MGKYTVVIEENARKELKSHFKSGNQATIKKIEKILFELTETPISGVGQPEELKHGFTGFWSRRINQKDRLIYSIDNDIVTVYVVSAMGHYSDK